MLYTSELTNKSYKTVEELEAAEAELIAAQDAKTKEREARQADVVVVQDKMNEYLKLVSENNAKREELKKAEQEAYEAYRAQLDEFAEKHNNYRLTYTINGDNAEFKVEECYAKTFAQQLEEAQERSRRIFENFFGFRF